MSRGKEIQYDSAVSVKENAKRNGVSEATIRYFIKTHYVDRRFDRKESIIEECRKYLRKHPKATQSELQMLVKSNVFVGYFGEQVKRINPYSPSNYHAKEVDKRKPIAIKFIQELRKNGELKL